MCQIVPGSGKFLQVTNDDSHRHPSLVRLDTVGTVCNSRFSLPFGPYMLADMRWHKYCKLANGKGHRVIYGGRIVIRVWFWDWRDKRNHVCDGMLASLAIWGHDFVFYKLYAQRIFPHLVVLVLSQTGTCDVITVR
jgi:hypothetical protein